MKIASLSISALFGLLLLLTACGQKNNNTTTTATNTPATADTTKKYTLGMVVNKKDLSCGMPLTAGLEDTAHYNGKAYGFCSKECKNEFLKNPAAYVAKMK